MTRIVKKNSVGTQYPVYGGGDETFRTDQYNREDQLIISRFGMSEKCVRFVNGKFYLNDSGMSLNLIGGLGTGKTSLSCSIAKAALVKGYSCHYTNMKDIANKLSVSSKDFSDYISFLQTRDFLIVDEVDGRWVLQSERSEKFFGSTIEHLLRSRYLEQLPTIVCSNSVDVGDIFGDDFKESLKSLFSKYAETVIVVGKDKRRQ